MHKSLWTRNLKQSFSPSKSMIIWSVSMILLAGLNTEAQGNKWGASAGYNNPAGSSLGLNIISMGSTFGFEVGVGGLSATSNDKNSNAGLWGDADVKIFFAEKLRPYIEAGFATGLGGQAGDDSGLGLSAGSPFVGGGLLYQGSSLFGYAALDYRLNSKTWVAPVFGLGLQF
jgi:hypothetical protein